MAAFDVTMTASTDRAERGRRPPERMLSAGTRILA